MENIGIHTESNPASVLGSVISIDLANTCGTYIDEFTNSKGETIYRLRTVDYVANEWNEYFGSLSIALMRLAVLAGTIEHEIKTEGEMMAFRHDPTKFAENAYKFIDNEVK